MDIVNFKEKQIQGISIRTTNAAEMNPKTAKIGALHQSFDQQITVDYKKGARVYGVYFNYESDASGEFSVLSGADEVESSNVELETITLAKGKYRVFKGKGEMPKAVIDAWGAVWAFYSHSDNQEIRAYKTDFEHYTNQDEVAIYIGVL